MGETAATVLTVAGSVVGAYLVYLGVRFTAAKSKEGVDRTADVSAQAHAVEAWKELVDPLREEVGRLRGELADERKERRAKEQSDARNRADEKQKIAQQISALTERIDLQAEQIRHWKRLARTIARFAAQMRDEVLRLGGTVPATPEELLLIQSIDDEDL